MATTTNYSATNNYAYDSKYSIKQTVNYSITVDNEKATASISVNSIMLECTNDLYRDFGNPHGNSFAQLWRPDGAHVAPSGTLIYNAEVHGLENSGAAHWAGDIWSYNSSNGNRYTVFSGGKVKVKTNTTIILSKQAQAFWLWNWCDWSVYNGDRILIYNGPSQRYGDYGWIQVTIPALTPYAVTYNANGGNGSVASQQKWTNESLTLRSNSFTRSGYSFYRWNTKADGTGTWYNSGATYTGNAALTLYAIWNPTIAYNTNGGSGSFSTQSKTFGVSIALNSSAPTRTGYVFWHWNTRSDNTGDSYSSGQSYTSNTSVTLYAIWNPLIYYNGNATDSGNIPATQTKTFNTNLALSSQIPTRPGYAFVKWTTASNGTGTAYNPGSTYTGNATMTLYAQWRRTAYPPTISSMSVVRCNKAGTANDVGTYFKCTVSWSVDTTSDDVPNNQLKSLTGSYVPSTGGTAVTWSSWSGSYTGVSGMASAIVGPVDTDTQYGVSVTAIDKNSNVSAGTTTRSDILTRAFFVIDFKANGNALGIGSAAPNAGFEVGWAAQFDKTLDVLGRFSAANYKQTYVSTAKSIISAAGTWTINDAKAYKCGHLCHVYVSARNSVAQTQQSQVGTLQSGWRPALTGSYGCANGGGYCTTGGAVYFRPYGTLNANTTIYFALVFYMTD